MLPSQADTFQKYIIGNIHIQTCRINWENIGPGLNYRIFIPRCLSESILAWYHEVLNHPGASRTYSTVILFLMWTVMKVDVEILVKTCPKFQNLNKTTNQTYGSVLFRESEVFPWSINHVELVGPCTILFKTLYGTNLNKTISALTEV